MKQPGHPAAWIIQVVDPGNGIKIAVKFPHPAVLQGLEGDAVSHQIDILYNGGHLHAVA